jgi:hypothetical protein
LKLRPVCLEPFTHLCNTISQKTGILSYTTVKTWKLATFNSPYIILKGVMHSGLYIYCLVCFMYMSWDVSLLPFTGNKL